MSLVSNEGEGEQNEIRCLQDKLNSTMKLVSHLTSQLNELKEQVTETSRTGILKVVLQAVDREAPAFQMSQKVLLRCSVVYTGSKARSCFTFFTSSLPMLMREACKGALFILL